MGDTGDGNNGDGGDDKRRPKVPYTTNGRSRVAASDGVVFRPRQVVIDLGAVGLDPHRDDNHEQWQAAVDGVLALLGELPGCERSLSGDDDLERAKRSNFLRVEWEGDLSVSTAVRALTHKYGRLAAAPNVVFRVGALVSSPMHLAPMHLAPMHLAPMHLAPMHLAPMHLAPMHLAPMHLARLEADYGLEPDDLLNSSTARPASAPTAPVPETRPSKASVAILDTGFPGLAADSGATDGIDVPTGDPQIHEVPDENSDGFLDIAAGHMTFIASMIRRASPGAKLFCRGFGENDGDVDETKVADLLGKLFDEAVASGADMSRLVLNLSFGGYYPDDRPPPQIAAAIREFTKAGAVVVAAAGNDASCRKKFPAAMHDVVAVGALGRCGPAWFSNYGDWVDACAPGEDLVSGFFTDFDGDYEPADGSGADDFDDFDGWAQWSGTSFACPAVVGALVQIIDLYGCTAQDARYLLLERPGLFHLPNLGVVVNSIF